MTARVGSPPARPAAFAWWRHFWDGLSPWAFIREELRLNPVQRRAALRAFAGLMVISLLSVALRPPPFVALSFSIVLMFASKALDARSAVAQVLRLLLEVAIATVLSVLTLALWGDQPWFLLPWSTAIITLLLFYTRITGGSSFPALFYVVSVFYFPLRAVQDAYLALSTNLIALLGGGAVLLTHAVLWPSRPDKTLLRLLSERLDRLGRVLDRLSRPGFAAASPQQPLEGPIPGVLSDQLTLLQTAGRVRPALYAKRQAYLDLIVDLDAWFNLATWVQRNRLENPAAWLPAAPDRARFRALSECCGELRGLLTAKATDASEDYPSAPVPAGRPGFALRQLEQAAERTRRAVLAVLAPPEEAPAVSAPAGPGLVVSSVWFTPAFWRENSATLHFGLKYAFGVVICLLLIQAFNWPGIDTAMMTCLVVAQSSLGADYRKSMLRLLGASGGGLLALFFIVVLQPALTTVAGFLLAVAPACGLAAWVAAGSPRLSYMGVQIGYSFASVVLHGTGPVTDLALARDRVIGILLGISVMMILDYLLWPHRATHQIRAPLVRALRNLAGFVSAGSGSAADSGLKFMHEIDRDTRQTLELLDQARLEPGADRPEAEAERVRASLLAGDVHRVARTLQTRLRHRLGSGQAVIPEPARALPAMVDLRLSKAYTALADHLADGGGAEDFARQETGPLLEEALQALRDERPDNPSEAHELAIELEFDLLLSDALGEMAAHVQGLRG